MSKSKWWKDTWKLVYDLRDFSYDTGYLSGRGQDGSEQHKNMIAKRDEAYAQVQALVTSLEKSNAELLEACELLVNTPANQTRNIQAAWDKARAAITNRRQK